MKKDKRIYCENKATGLKLYVTAQNGDYELYTQKEAEKHVANSMQMAGKASDQFNWVIETNEPS